VSGDQITGMGVTSETEGIRGRPVVMRFVKAMKACTGESRRSHPAEWPKVQAEARTLVGSLQLCMRMLANLLVATLACGHVRQQS
jgi:hypothetical protein